MEVRQPRSSDAPDAPIDFDDCLQKAEQIFDRAVKDRGGPITTDQRQSFNTEAQSLRWFLLPSEAKDLLRGVALPKVEAPFTPRKYVSDTQLYELQHYSTIPVLNNQTSNTPEIDTSPLLPKEENKPTAQSVVENIDNGVEPSDDNDVFLANSRDFAAILEFDDDDEKTQVAAIECNPKNTLTSSRLWKSPVRNIMKPTLEALLRYKMISNGDRVLVCVSGGKDSLTLLHTLRQYQQQSKRFGIQFEIGAMTVDPGSSSYDPSPLIPYMEQLGIPYFYERQCMHTVKFTENSCLI